MSIAVNAHAPTGDKLADIEAFARALLAVNAIEETTSDMAASEAARSIGAELLRLLKGKPREGITLGTQ
ncbi:MAG: hypothetical protein WBX27_04845 [Specibacter sp.]